jgi:hypothetical protein
MPYKSKAQMAMMHAKHPEVAKKWDAEMKEKGEPMPKKEHASDMGHAEGKKRQKMLRDGTDAVHRDHTKKSGY